MCIFINAIYQKMHGLDFFKTTPLHYLDVRRVRRVIKIVNVAH
jgi:hypothetical protein